MAQEKNKLLPIHDFKKRVDPIIDTLDLNDTQRFIIKKRFVHEVVNYDTKASRTKRTYNGFRFLVTTGSLLIPALLSIQQIGGTSQVFKDNIYWTTWSLSLAVTTCNGFIQLFSLDKNYFTFSIITEKLKTEGWQFLQLSGKYDKFKSHKKAYKTFCNNIETLKIKQVMTEFSSGKASTNKDKGKVKNETDSEDEDENNKNLNKNLNKNNDNKNNNNNNNNKNMNNDIEKNLDINSGFNKQFIQNMNNTMNIAKPENVLLKNFIPKNLQDKIQDKIQNKIQDEIIDQREDIQDKLMENINGFNDVINNINGAINAEPVEDDKLEDDKSTNP